MNDVTESKETTAICIDWDNFFISGIKTRSLDFRSDIIGTCSIIKDYAESLGKLIMPYVFITSNTEKQLEVLLRKFKNDLNFSVNIVPPDKDAADAEIVKHVELILKIPEIKYITLCGRDAKAFLPLCKKIHNGGRKVHIITPGASFGGLFEVADKVISFFTLLNNAKKHTSVKKRTKNNFICNKFIFAAIKLNRIEKRQTKETMRTNDEEFTNDCLGVIKNLNLNNNNWFSFEKMTEEVWGKIKIKGKDRCFTYNDCRLALSALIQIGLLYSEEKKLGDEIRVRGYFYWGFEENNKNNKLSLLQ